MKSREQDHVLGVRFAAPLPDESTSIRTRSGVIRWAYLDGTLIIQPETPISVDDRPLVEHLVRTVMKHSGLAKRFHVFVVRREPQRREPQG